MNSEEREKLQYILSILKGSNEIFNVSLGPKECSLLVKYIDYLRGD